MPISIKGAVCWKNNRWIEIQSAKVSKENFATGISVHDTKLFSAIIFHSVAVVTSPKPSMTCSFSLTFSAPMWHPWASHSTSWWFPCRCSKGWAWCCWSKSWGRWLQMRAAWWTTSIETMLNINVRQCWLVVGLVAHLGFTPQKYLPLKLVMRNMAVFTQGLNGMAGALEVMIVTVGTTSNTEGGCTWGDHYKTALLLDLFLILMMSWYKLQQLLMILAYFPLQRNRRRLLRPPTTTTTSSS